MTLAFADCELNAESRELSRAGEPVSIEPKTLDLLIYLINNRERAIGKDELQDEVWGTIVSDAALTRAVMKLRKAVGDTSKDSIVKTVPRFGYRFVAHIKYGSTTAEIGPPARKSIAVLPLQNMSGDVENEYFSDGIAEEILNLLAKLPTLRVASRTSSFAFRNSDKTAKEISSALDVEILLEGSVRRAGDRVRITMQLIDAEDDAHIWSEIYNRELTDIFEVQADIAREVVSAITRGEAGEIVSYQATDSPQAYDYYLRGYKKFHELDRGSIRQVREMFRKALEIDPQFAKAWAGLANASCFLYMWWEASRENIDEANLASLRALELGADLAEAHTSRGFVLSLLEDFEAAKSEFEQALRLDPLLYDAWYLYARACYAGGEMEKAAELFIKAGEVRPDDYQALSLAASAYLRIPDREKSDECAREQVRRSERHLAINPGDTRAWCLGACNIGELGDVARGERWVNRALKLAPDDVGVLHLAACFYGARGDVEKTIHFLERRTKNADAYFAWMENDPDFDSVRDDPRFIAMVKRQREREERPST